MRKYLPIICGIIIGVILFFKSGILAQLAVLLLPVYFSVRNIMRQRNNSGNWTLDWTKFGLAFVLELIVFGAPAYVIVFSEPHPPTWAFLILAVYVLVTSFAYGFSKNPAIDHIEDLDKRKQGC